jgi:hypothetical protein
MRSRPLRRVLGGDRARLAVDGATRKQRRARGDGGRLRQSHLAFLACLPGLLPLHASGDDVAIVLYLGVFQVAGAYFFLTRGLRTVPVLERRSLLLEPVLNPVWAWLARREARTVVSDRWRRDPRRHGREVLGRCARRIDAPHRTCSRTAAVRDPAAALPVRPSVRDPLDPGVFRERAAWHGGCVTLRRTVRARRRIR